jgi:radical SAM protein with 4Fe4S-binding SPASM domain
VFLTTNGTACTEEKLRAVFAAGLDSLKFSLNYADAGQFAQITRTAPRLFERLKENIKLAWRLRQEGGYKCGLFASYIRFDSEQDARMEELLAELRPYLDEVYALPIYSQAARIQMGGWKFSGGNQGRADNPVPPVPCWGLFRAGHVNFDGTVCGCCFSVGDEFTMGDLKRQSFMEAWHSEKFQTLRRAHLSHDVRGTACEGCIKQVAL